LPKTSGKDSSIITIFGYLFLYVGLVISYYKKKKVKK
ncbi:TPA: LPXTG cell wall anchor domain-containing protein, partial [Enterococcus faecalis]|nr:LPXTG cell wall anchor domain-containing protein [Enterococcus faecalis]